MLVVVATEKIINIYNKKNMEKSINEKEQCVQTDVMQSVLAKDLRLGNKLLFLGDVVTFKNITEIREDGIFWIKTFEPKIESKNFHFRPIPLTEEWLFKLGFFKYNNAYVLEKPTENIMNFKFSIWNDFTYNSSEFPIELKYVHQLQNLYFALTQSELTVA